MERSKQLTAEEAGELRRIVLPVFNELPKQASVEYRCPFSNGYKQKITDSGNWSAYSLLSLEQISGGRYIPLRNFSREDLRCV